jgi:hypothetical protein
MDLRKNSLNYQACLIFLILCWHNFSTVIKKNMDRTSKSPQQKNIELRDEASIGGKLPGRNVSEKMDIEQTREENRREADLDDKTPAGDGGPEDETYPEKDDGASNY